MTTRADFEKSLWEAIGSLRGKVDPDVTLGLLFLKALSDWRDEQLATYRSKYQGDEIRVARAMSRERFVLPDDCTFQRLYANRDSDGLGETINSVLRQLEGANVRKLEGVFGRLDFNSVDLGTARERNARLRKLLDSLNELEHVPIQHPEGAAEPAISPFNELIRHIVEENGRRDAAAFSTPREISTLIARLVSPTAGERIYDPCCGTGGLLLRAAQMITSDDIALFGQEPRHSIWSTCKMNLILAGMDAADIHNDDPIRRPIVDKHNQLQKYDIVVSDPTFAAKDWGAEGVANDPRFRRGVPPKSSGDYAFITHAVETMHPQNGRACLLVPLGALFREGAEGLIRRRLIEENLLEGIIRLPVNALFGTSIQSALMLFRTKKRDESVLFIDASGDQSDEVVSRTKLREQDIDKIVSAWNSRTDISGYSRLASHSEIQAHEFNLNVPLYVKIDHEEQITFEEATARVSELERELRNARSALSSALQTLREAKTSQ